jgi:phage-related protein
VNAVEILFRGSSTGAVAAAEETSTAIKGVGTSGAIATGEVGKLERGVLAGSGAFSSMSRSIAYASAAFLGAELGGPLLAGLNAVAAALSTVIGWAQKNRAVLEPLAAIVGITAGAWVVFEGVVVGIPALVGLVSTAMEVLTATMYGLPIVGIVALLATLGVALVELWKHSQTFRDIVIGAWNALKGATVAVVDFIKEHWRAGVIALAAIIFGPIGAIVAFVVTHWAQIRAETISVWNAVKGAVSDAVHTVRSVVSQVFGALAGIVHSAAAGVRSGVSAIVGAFHPVLSVLQEIIHLAEEAGGILDKIAHKAGGVLSHIPGAGLLSHIPGFASGVTNYAGGLAWVGENGPELMNIPRGASVFSNAASTRMLAGGSGPSVTYNIHVTSLATTGRGVAQELAKIVRSAPRTPAITVLGR